VGRLAWAALVVRNANRPRLTKCTAPNAPPEAAVHVRRPIAAVDAPP
jgi:hypothetical protein